MLARASSDAGTRLRRSKSTSTVHRHPPPLVEPLDPHVARQHALKAATVAFARSQGIEASGRQTKRSSEMSRSKSNASRKSLTSQGSHFPPRMSSSRSLRGQKVRQNTSSHQSSYTNAINTEQFPPFCPRPSMERPSSMRRPLSAQPSITLTEEARPRSQPKTSRQSASSSITSQQLRKARSMYYASSIQTGSPIARPPAKFLATPPPISVTPASALESTSVLPANRTLELSPLAGARIPVTLTTDETLDAARDKYLQGFQQKSVKHKPSIFLAPFKKRQEKSKEKTRSIISSIATVDTNNQRTPENSMVDASLQDFLPPPKTKEKRSFSGSLRNRLKKVFRRASDKTPNLPVQQIDASRNYFMTHTGNLPARTDGYAIPSPDEETLQRVRSRNPSDIGPSSVPRSQSRNSSSGSAQSNKSNRSLHSEINATHVSASRMTSWATSSTADALTHGAIKRLTVIHESKDSMGSEADRLASAIPRRKSLPPTILSAFRDPMPMQSVTEDSLAFVDPKRVFSALMREMGTTKSTQSPSHSVDQTPGAESDVFESRATKGFNSKNNIAHLSTSPEFELNKNGNDLESSHEHTSASTQNVQGKTSTMKSLGKAIRSTIRAVTPMERQSTIIKDERALSVLSATCSTTNTSTIRVTPSSGEAQNSNEQGAFINSYRAQEECSSVDHNHAIEIFTPSLSQIEKRIERTNDRWKTPLEATETPQFPRETARTYNVANIVQQTLPCETPSRRVFGHVERPQTDFYGTTEANGHELMTSIEFPMSPTPHGIKSPLSPSIYSRNTDGISILPNESVVSLRAPERYAQKHDEGSALILTSQSVRSYVIGTPSPNRPDSTRISRDWKDWLSHEISGIDLTSQENLRIHEHFETPSNRPRRNAVRSSHTEHSEATVILHEPDDSRGPTLDEETPNSFQGIKSPEQQGIPAVSVHQYETEREMMASRREEYRAPMESYEEVDHGQNLKIKGTDSRSSSRINGNTFPDDRNAPSAVAFSSIPAQPVFETPKSSRMNDRFLFFETGVSSSNNSTGSSCRSRSPAGSIVSSKSPKLSKRIIGSKHQSNLSAPSPAQTCRRIYTRAMKEHDGLYYTKKENFTTTDLRENVRPSSSLSQVPSRPTTSQSISSAPTDCKRSNVGPYLTNTPTISHFKRNSSPATNLPRPFVRVTLHPVSPEKLSRRPKSVYSLRKANAQDLTQTGKHSSNSGLATPSSGLPSERRRTALHVKASSSSLALNKEPSPGIEQRVIDNVLESERSGSITPGQRMADRFLKERKSASMLDGVRMRGGLRLPREDTPAFL